MLVRVLPLVYFLMFFTGCGTGGGGGWIPLGIGTGGNREGQLELRVAWPGAVSKGKLIPAAADRIEIVVTGQGLSSPVTQTVPKDQVQNGQVTVSFSEVPVGGKVVEVKALNSSGAIVAHRMSSVTIQESQTATITAELGITITDSGYIPSQFVLNKGEKLLWVNNDSQTHRVVSDDGLLDAGNVAPGGSFSWTADTPGDIPFRCVIHADKTGTLHVQFPPPSIVSTSPTRGPSGTKLTLTGTDFGAQKSKSTVTVGGISAPVVSWSDTQVTCTIPAGAGVTDGMVTMTVGGAGSNLLAFTVTPTVAWTQTYNGPANGMDYGQDIAADGNGNILVIGYENRADIGQSDNIWLRKYDSDGNTIWTQSYDNPSNDLDNGYGIAADYFGNIYATGLEIRNDLGQSYNIWVRKYDPSGTIQWPQSYNSPANNTDWGSAVTVDGQGNVYVEGVENRPDLGQGLNIWVRKYDSQGNTVWTQTYNSPGNSDDRSSGIAVDSSGNVYVVGYEARGDLGQNWNVWVRKYDANGAILWTRTYNSPANNDDRGAGIAVDGSGNVLVTGYENRPDLGESFNLWVRKYDPAGNVLWTQTYNDTTNAGDYGDGVAVDIFGNVYVTGYELRLDLGQSINTLLRKYDPNGNTLWTETYNNPANGADFGYAVKVDAIGNIYVAGVEDRPDLGQSYNIWVRKYRQ